MIVANALSLPVENRGHLVEPPIVDSLAWDEQRRAWVVSFVPEERVSRRQKELVVIPAASADAQRIRLRMQRLESLLGTRIERLFHSGDGNFTFHTRDGHPIELASPHGQIDLSLKAYVELTDIAMTAQIYFESSRLVHAA
jgi:hypothetical protein